MSSVLIDSLLTAINQVQVGTYSLRKTPIHSGHVWELRRGEHGNETVFTASSTIGLIAMLKVYLQGLHHGRR